MKLVIVESPTKSKTIGKYLGKDFKVLASAGHIRDLPTQETITLTGGKRETIDVENDFDEYYEIPDRQKKNVVKIVSSWHCVFNPNSLHYNGETHPRCSTPCEDEFTQAPRWARSISRRASSCDLCTDCASKG